MNTAQIASAARLAVVFVGGIAVTKGLVSQEMVDRASDITTITQVVGAFAALGTAGYSIWKRRPAGIIESAAALPQVAEIQTTPRLADAIPSNKVVPADASLSR